MLSLPTPMIKVYLQRRFSDIEKLQQSVEEGSVEEFHRVGHQVAGNARNFGFDQLEKLAARMEFLPAADLASVGPELIREMADFIRRESAKIDTGSAAQIT